MSRCVRTRWAGNRLIDSLPEDQAQHLRSFRQFPGLSPGTTIYGQNTPTSCVYFPVIAVYSHVVLWGDGQRIEVATIGNEGMLGLHVVLGLDFSPAIAVCQVPGDVLCVPVPDFLRFMVPGGALDSLLRRYAAYRLREAGQNVACNAVHSVEQRACRRLLMAHDRVGKDEFALTHERLAEMLGVHRQTITLVARLLQAAGFITYRRGVVAIINRQGLESASCECYEASKVAYESIVSRG